MFLPTTFSLTQHFIQKHELWLHFFAENTQYYHKMHSNEDNAKFHSAFLVTMHNNDTRLLNIWANLKKFMEMLVELCFVSISDWKMQKNTKKSLKTDYVLMHVYL